MMFGESFEKWEEKKAHNTAKEILQQPELWRETLEIFEKNKEKLSKFFEEIKLDESFDIVFTGAGTSEYVGNILVPFLKKKSKLNFKSFGTTEILNSPFNFLDKDKKLLLVSFARSGDSPESVGVVNLVNENVKEVYHLFITCNEDGALAKMSKESKNTFLLLMPKESNDKGFAMTGSFSCMLLSAILTFDSRNLKEEMLKVIDVAENELATKYGDIKKIAEENHQRIVILGSSFLSGLSQELSLKIMELSAGAVVSVNNTTLGFRHGPKSIVNNETIIFNLTNEDEYARKYDEGLLEEMYADETENTIVAYYINESEIINQNSHKVVTPEVKNIDKELGSIFVYLVYGQMYAFFKSQHLGKTTDNPFPSGEVNRVVKKFKVHRYGE